MLEAFIIWTVVALIFVAAGVSTWKDKKTAGFFTGVKPPKVDDVTGYNHSVAKLWFLFSAMFEVLGVVLLFTKQNDPAGMFIAIGAMVLILFLIIAYLFVAQKYRVE